MICLSNVVNLSRLFANMHYNKILFLVLILVLPLSDLYFHNLRLDNDASYNPDNLLVQNVEKKTSKTSRKSLSRAESTKIHCTILGRLGRYQTERKYGAGTAPSYERISSDEGLTSCYMGSLFTFGCCFM